MYTYYEFNEEKYAWLKQNPDKVAWRDFADGRKDFDGEWANIANPYLKDDYDEFWKEYFSNYFECDVKYNFVLRIINSFMITGESPITKPN